MVIIDLMQPQVERILRRGFGYTPIDWGADLAEEYDLLIKAQKRRMNVTKEVLEIWSPARNNDRLLDWECLRVEFPEIQVTSSFENVIFKIPKKIVKFLPSPEAYSRARRRLIQKATPEEAKKYLPTDKYVILRRIKREKALRKYYSDKNA